MIVRYFNELSPWGTKSSYLIPISSCFQGSSGRTRKDLTRWNSGAVQLKGGKDGPWIVNRQFLKIYLVDEQKEEREVEEVSFLIIEQAEALRKERKV